MRFALTAVGALSIAMFGLRVLKNIRDTGDKFDFTPTGDPEWLRPRPIRTAGRRRSART